VHAKDGIISSISKVDLEKIIKGTLRDVISKNLQAQEQLKQKNIQK